ncbi:hypothetical protein BH23ACT5_BH23ACT5_15020 [soil metagenome]
MANRATERRWLGQLTSIPTAPGSEHRVMAWVRNWAGRRPDVLVREDAHGNLLLTQRGRQSRAPVVAVAHTDHPGFVVTDVTGRAAAVEFRGGVRREYFESARLEVFDCHGEAHRGRLTGFDHDSSTGLVLLDRVAPLAPGDMARWSFGSNRVGLNERFALAPACDDLAGAAAALAALDRARGERRLRHLGVLLTRAEEVGFVGAIGAYRDRTVPADARILSIECSRASADAPLGAGPVVRVGDASSVFDHRVTNVIAEAASVSGLTHQRKLMTGGSCEATAFVAYGYAATGLCLPLRNYHNMGFLDEVEQGKGKPTLLPEMVSIADYHGLIDLLLLATRAVDTESSLVSRLEDRFAGSKEMLA